MHCAISTATRRTHKPAATRVHREASLPGQTTSAANPANTCNKRPRRTQTRHHSNHTCAHTQLPPRPRIRVHFPAPESGHESASTHSGWTHFRAQILVPRYGSLSGPALVAAHAHRITIVCTSANTFINAETAPLRRHWSPPLLAPTQKPGRPSEIMNGTLLRKAQSFYIKQPCPRIDGTQPQLEKGKRPLHRAPSPNCCTQEHKCQEVAALTARAAARSMTIQQPMNVQ